MREDRTPQMKYVYFSKCVFNSYRTFRFVRWSVLTLRCSIGNYHLFPECLIEKNTGISLSRFREDVKYPGHIFYSYSCISKFKNYIYNIFKCNKKKKINETSACKTHFQLRYCINILSRSKSSQFAWLLFACTFQTVFRVNVFTLFFFFTTCQYNIII